MTNALKTLSLALLVAVTAPQIAQAEDNAALKAAIAGEQRSAEDKARDRFRNPHQTLTFFQVEPDMAVAEIWPGGGWYTKILAPYLKNGGSFSAIHFDHQATEGRSKESFDAFNEAFGDAAVYGTIGAGSLSAESSGIAADGSLDRVLTFRNLHNWMRGDFADKAFADFYKALKPGGMLGMIDHRADGDEQADLKASNGYVTEAYAIARAEAAGFELVDRSDINSNPRDTKDHEAGVWTLPPRLRLKDKMSAEELETVTAIGESDRMTLLFRKPTE